MPALAKLLCTCQIVISLGLADSFNVCNINEKACVPLLDFQVNCTCMLYPSASYSPNLTDGIEKFLFFEGYEIPLGAFDHRVLPRVLRAQLSFRLPTLSDFEQHLEIPETIFKDLQVEEASALFFAPTSSFAQILSSLLEEEVLKTTLLRNNSRWCAEDECDVFVDEALIANITAGEYAFASDILQVIELSGWTLFAASGGSVLSLEEHRRRVCATKCRRFYWDSKRLCEDDCFQKIRFDRISLTAEMKAKFKNFIRASAIANLRQKYASFVKSA